MTTVADWHIVGLPAFSQDGSKLGKVKGRLFSGESAKYLVIGTFLSRGMVVPTDVVEECGDTVVVPFTRSYLDMAPPIDSLKPISPCDCDRLRDYYHIRES